MSSTMKNLFNLWYNVAPLSLRTREFAVQLQARRDAEMNERVLQAQIDEEGCGDFFARAIYQNPFFRD